MKPNYFFALIFLAYTKLPIFFFFSGINIIIAPPYIRHHLTNRVRCNFGLYSLMCPQHKIKHKAAINIIKHWLHTMIAPLCFILYCDHINKHGLILLLQLNKQKETLVNKPGIWDKPHGSYYSTEPMLADINSCCGLYSVFWAY